MEEKKITVWQRGTKRGDEVRWEHNHIEDGWADAAAPKPISMLQAAQWNGALWQKRHTTLRDGVII